MFSLMGKCFSCLKRKTQPRREITLAILGLDNAGKTTATKALLGESLEVAPTVGFISESLVLDQFEIKIFDLGGGKKIRNIWTKYFTEVYGIVYVVDSSASDRIDEAKETLQELLRNEKVAGKPVLLLANKQDQPNAMDEVDICEKINLENLVNINKCPCRINSDENVNMSYKSPLYIETCSAIKGTGKKIDKNIKLGLKWICATLDHNWGVYQPRVEMDMEEAAVRKQKELEEKRERVRKIREEREKKEEEERKRLGIEKLPSDDEDVLDGDPFKRVDINKLNEKEKRMKEEKRKKKEIELSMLGQNTNETKGREEEEESDEGEIRSSRSLKYLGLHSKLNDSDFGMYNGNANTMNNKIYDSGHDSDEEISTRKTRRATPRLPPLQKPLGTKFSSDDQPSTIKKKKKKKKLKALQENKEMEEHEDSYAYSKHSVQSVSTIEVKSRDSDSYPEILDQSYLYNANLKPNKHIVVGKTLQIDDTEEELTPRLKGKKKKKGKSKGTHQSFDEFPSTPRNGETEENSSHLDSPTNEYSEENQTQVRKLKKKAYLKKNNRTAPSDEDIETAETLRESSIRDMKWTLASPKKENHVLSSDDNDHLVNRNWGFAEDLGDTIDNSSTRKIGVRPNFDDDDVVL